MALVEKSAVEQRHRAALPMRPVDGAATQCVVDIVAERAHLVGPLPRLETGRAGGSDSLTRVLARIRLQPRSRRWCVNCAETVPGGTWGTRWLVHQLARTGQRSPIASPITAHPHPGCVTAWSTRRSGTGRAATTSAYRK